MLKSLLTFFFFFLVYWTRNRIKSFDSVCIRHYILLYNSSVFFLKARAVWFGFCLFAFANMTEKKKGSVWNIMQSYMFMQENVYLCYKLAVIYL